MDSDISKNIVTELVFPKLEKHAHKIIQYAIKLVEKLLSAYESYSLNSTGEDFQDDVFEKIQNVWNLLFYFTSGDEPETIKKIFRYFAAAEIYSQIMLKSYKALVEYNSTLNQVERNE